MNSRHAGDTAPHTGLYQIGMARLNVPGRQLSFNDEPVDVQPKVFDLLAYLVLHRDRVVSKDELFDEVWPSVVVSDASLSQTIKRARDLFRKRGFDAEIIRTVARQGYQFNHDVVIVQSDSIAEAIPSTPTAQPTQRQPRRAGLLAIAVLGASIAVFALWLQPSSLLPTETPTDQVADSTLSADELVMRGQRERAAGSQASTERAEQLFREALALEPDHHEALVALAAAVQWRGVTGSIPRDEAFRESRTLLERAVGLAPDNGQAHLELAVLQHRHFWDFDGAQSSFDRALALMPQNAVPVVAYSRFLAKSGKPKQALASALTALDLDQRSARAHSNLVMRQLKLGELDSARQTIDALRALEPQHVDLPWLETNWHLRNGSNRDALQWSTLEEFDHLRLCLGAIALRRLERTQQAQVMLQELIDEDAAGSAFQIAETYAQWGNIEQAFAWLERALSSGDPGMIELYSSLNLERLYSDSRFASLARRVGLPPAPSIEPAS